eukprot:9627401-Karenia_brevis.AAC.1
MCTLTREQIKQILDDVDKEVEEEMKNEGKQDLQGHQQEIKRWPRCILNLVSRRWALDLHTCDEDGREWDFNYADMRDRAYKKVAADKPLLVVLSPMCAPFSMLQNINYAKDEPDKVRKKIRYGIRHLAFAMKICRIQLEQG